MKSYVQLLSALYAAVLEDARALGIISGKDVIRDLSRLDSLVKSRGLSVFTLDLPALGKHVDKCLAEGRLSSSNLPLSKGDKRSGANPRLFAGMFLRVFDRTGLLRSDVDICAVKALRQLFFAGKKLRLQCDDSRTYETVREYFDIETSLPNPALCWDEDRLDVERARDLSLLETIPKLNPASNQLPLFTVEEDNECRLAAHIDSVQRVADIVSCELGWFDPLDWPSKHGPGAVADARRESDKYAFPTWPAKLDAVFPIADFGFANYRDWADRCASVQSGMFRPHEAPSRLIAVPKTQKGPRLIACEPVAHQWAQQNVKAFLTDRVRATSIGKAIDFSSQEKSRSLALEASRSGSHWTIDLSSASDRVSCYLVERMFRRNLPLLEAYHACRTRWLSNKIDAKSPEFVRLRKFAAMGSALTFPVQTYIYTMIIAGVILWEDGARVSRRAIRRSVQEVQVFGDDMIVPERYGAKVVEVLTHLGFKVNVSKTFREGRFRESCGMDAFQGTDVTPAYVLTPPIRSKPESMISHVACTTNFATRGWWRAAAVLKSIGVSAGLDSVADVVVGSGMFGWPAKVADTSPLRSRWNNQLQRKEVLAQLPVARVSKRLSEHNTDLLQYFTEAPSPTSQWTSGIGLRPTLHLRRRWVPSLSFATVTYPGREWELANLCLSQWDQLGAPR